MNREDVLSIVGKAHEAGKNPNLYGADLSDTDLRGVNLYGADMRDANLRRADLRRADLRGAKWHGLRIDGLPSRQLTLTPTPDGWDLRFGCWHGTPEKLRELIARNEDWPKVKGAEIARRRPYLQAALKLCEVHVAEHADYINELKEKWNA